eukprot:COSAG05_NODE_2521_length_2949_cov_152.630175_2_plen_422_part_00
MAQLPSASASTAAGAAQSYTPSDASHIPPHSSSSSGGSNRPNPPAAAAAAAAAPVMSEVVRYLAAHTNGESKHVPLSQLGVAFKGRLTLSVSTGSNGYATSRSRPQKWLEQYPEVFVLSKRAKGEVDVRLTVRELAKFRSRESAANDGRTAATSGTKQPPPPPPPPPPQHHQYGQYGHYQQQQHVAATGEQYSGGRAYPSVHAPPPADPTLAQRIEELAARVGSQLAHHHHHHHHHPPRANWQFVSQLEVIMRDKHAADARFNFLCHRGSEGEGYYLWRRFCAEHGLSRSQADAAQAHALGLLTTGEQAHAYRQESAPPSAAAAAVAAVLATGGPTNGGGNAPARESGSDGGSLTEASTVGAQQQQQQQQQLVQAPPGIATHEDAARQQQQAMQLYYYWQQQQQHLEKQQQYYSQLQQSNR